MLPRETANDQVIAYLASGFDSTRSDYMAVAIKNGEYVAIHSTDIGWSASTNAYD